MEEKKERLEKSIEKYQMARRTPAKASKSPNRSPKPDDKLPP